MRLSEFFAQLNAIPNVDSFEVYLAAPDQDRVDVDLASVGRVETDAPNGVVRVYPASTATDVDSVDPEPYLGMVLEQLPVDATGENDLRLLAEIPLLRDEVTDIRPTLVDIAAIRVGQSSQEVWLLTRPPAEFADGLLPT